MNSLEKLDSLIHKVQMLYRNASLNERHDWKYQAGHLAVLLIELENLRDELRDREDEAGDGVPESA